MTKPEVIQFIVEKTNLPKNTVTLVLDEMNSLIMDTLKKGDVVKISGFGVFSAKQKEARKGRNPKTGEAVNIPAKKSPKFKASKEFKEYLG